MHTLDHIKRCLNGVYGHFSPPYFTEKCFRLVLESFEDNQRSEKPTGIITPQSISIYTEDMIFANRRLASEGTSSHL